MLAEQIIPGASVLCIFDCPRVGERAIITEVYYRYNNDLGSKIDYFIVSWDDGFQHDCRWGQPQSFMLIEESPHKSSYIPTIKGPSNYERTRHAMKFL